jgi:hypothetical protein
MSEKPYEMPAKGLRQRHLPVLCIISLKRAFDYACSRESGHFIVWVIVHDVKASRHEQGISRGFARFSVG